MSRENVELSVRVTDAFNGRDPEAMLALWDPSCEWLPAIEAEVAGEPVVYRGHDGFRQYVRDVAEFFEEYRFDASEYRDLGARVLVLGRFSARGRASGVEWSFVGAAIHEWRDSKCVRIVGYRHPEDALEAAGLSK
jgi:hypothetical protein